MLNKLYGIYNGEVYWIKPDVNGKVFLLPDTEDGSFDIIHATVVNSSDISEAYRLYPYVEINGIKADVAREAGDEYELWICNCEKAKELGFDRCDKYAYNKMVKKTDVTVLYEKKPVEFG